MARLVSAGQDPDGRYDGHDTSRTVRVTVHGSGRVEGIEIGRAWRDSVGADGLGPAVVDAIDNAIRQRFEVWGQAMERASADPEDDAEDDDQQFDLAGLRSTDAGRFPSPPGADGPRSPEAMSGLFHLAMDVMNRLDELSQAVDDDAARAVRTESASGRVAVTMESGQITKVDFDHRWLRDASAAEISENAQVTFDEAFRTHARAATSATAESLSFRELREVTADPAELLYRLGLHPRR